MAPEAVPTLDELEQLAAIDPASAALRLTGVDEPGRRAVGRVLVPHVATLKRQHGSTFDSDLIRRMKRLAPAVVATGTLPELKKLGWAALPWRGQLGLVGDLLTDRRPEWLSDWADWALEQDRSLFPLVRRLVREGTLGRPTSDAYILALMDGVPIDRGNEQPLRRALLDDPGLLEHEVWRLFEVEGGGEVSLANCDKYRFRGNPWSEALVLLADEGLLPRKRLLDASLAALGRDFSGYRAGWHARFHEALSPTLDERAARSDSYGGLLSSPIANTVAFAVAALAELDRAGRLPASAELVDRLRPALASERKLTIQRGITLLRSAVTRDSALAEPAALAACTALGHSDAAVQARALELIEPAAASPEVRAALLEITAAPTLRERITALVGIAMAADAPGAPDPVTLADDAAALPGSARELAGVDVALKAVLLASGPPPAVAFSVTDVPVLASAAATPPVADVDELIDVVGRVLELPDPAPDELERALDGIARLCDERPADFDRRTSSLRRRLTRPDRHGLHPLVAAWLTIDLPPVPWSLEHILENPSAVIRRSLELAPRVAARRALPLLATPTHDGAWLDPRVAIDRLRSLGMAGVEPGRHDLVQALLRLAPDHRAEALRDAAALTGDAASVMRAALGGDLPRGIDEELATAIELARGLDHAGPEYRVAYRDRFGYISLRATVDPEPSEAMRAAIPALRMGLDECWRSFSDPEVVGEEAAALVYLWPAGHRALWAHTTMKILTRGDGRSLEPALDPDRPLGELGALAVAAGLAHPDAGVRATAIDVVILAVSDGRLDAALLGSSAHSVCARPGHGQPTRLGPALRTVADESPLHAEVARMALERCVGLSPPARTLHAFLDPLNELCAEAGAGVLDDQARSVLGSLRGSTKAARLARALLERQGESRWSAAAAGLAAAGRIERARRWAAG